MAITKKLSHQATVEHPCNPSSLKGSNREDQVWRPALTKIWGEQTSKTTTAMWSGSVAQVAQCLLSKNEALNSNSSLAHTLPSFQNKLKDNMCLRGDRYNRYAALVHCWLEYILHNYFRKYLEGYSSHWKTKYRTARWSKNHTSGYASKTADFQTSKMAATQCSL
jgi:hypothetical protein